MTEVLKEVPFTSKIIDAPKVKRTPADLLAERSTFMRYITRTTGLTPPTIDELKKHAERFGTEAVVETAVELGYGLDSCIKLMDHCDRIEFTDVKKLHPYAKVSKVRPAEERCKALLGIAEEEDADS